LNKIVILELYQKIMCVWFGVGMVVVSVGWYKLYYLWTNTCIS